MRNYSVGTISSQGIGIAPIYRIDAYRKIECTLIDKSKVEDEKQRLLTARTQVEEQLIKIIEQTKNKYGEEHAELFEAHLALFLDDDFENDILDKIIQKLYIAEYAVEEFIDETCIEMMELDEYFQERVVDFKDLGRRLISTLQGTPYNNYKDIMSPVIVFAHDLTPSMTAQIDTAMIAGFVTETGGITSHVSFIAQNLNIPAIVGAKNILSHITNATHAIIDAIEGHIILDPDEDTIQEYTLQLNKFTQDIANLLENTKLPATTLDGTTITLLANIGGVQDIDSVLKNGAEGIGLFRTEFLFMGELPPSEEKQYKIYKTVIEAMGTKPVTIRTLDIGGDKQIPFLAFPHEDNPFLGYRALRIYADHAKIVGQQLRAIIRASAFGTVRIMIPMVISMHEIIWIKELISSIERDLVKEKHPIGEYYVGIMVETPSVAVMSDVFIKTVDFFSIGTNDLIQYTLAVDRGNETISDLYQPFHPAIIRLISQIVASADSAGKSVSVCGDMGGDEQAVLLLMGLGVRKISMSSSKIPTIKNMIRKVNFEKLKKNILQIQNMGTVKEIRMQLELISHKVMS